MSSNNEVLNTVTTTSESEERPTSALSSATTDSGFASADPTPTTSSRIPQTGSSGTEVHPSTSSTSARPPAQARGSGPAPDDEDDAAFYSVVSSTSSDDESDDEVDGRQAVVKTTHHVVAEVHRDPDADPATQTLQLFGHRIVASVQGSAVAQQPHQELAATPEQVRPVPGPVPGSVPGPVADQPSAGQVGLVAQEVGANDVATVNVAPADAPAAQASGRGRARGTPRRGRSRGRRGRSQRRRKREWELSEESLSSVDDEAEFPTRISPRKKKPFQGYTNF